MSPRSIFDLQAELCKTMGNATRLRIVHSLREHPKSVSEIVQDTKLAQAKVSQHLAILRAYGIVASKREGRDVIYRIANHKLVRVCDLMREVLAEQADERAEVFEALKEK
ncbi:MAG: metalloregulator ArsR/SmtB family transcription factor [Anaerolineae bacterium]|nr:metalloregulator ArsR/SmtB family transcription factor [Anaerolineae bacterium]